MMSYLLNYSWRYIFKEGLRFYLTHYIPIFVKLKGAIEEQTKKWKKKKTQHTPPLTLIKGSLPNTHTLANLSVSSASSSFLLTSDLLV